MALVNKCNGNVQSWSSEGTRNCVLFDFHETVPVKKTYVFQALWAAWSADYEHHLLSVESSVQSQVTASLTPQSLQKDWTEAALLLGAADWQIIENHTLQNK